MIEVRSEPADALDVSGMIQLTNPGVLKENFMTKRFLI
jgi:hypothetical protein